MKVDGKLALGIEETLRQMYDKVNCMEVERSEEIRMATCSSRETKVWLVHKIKGELVTETDPVGRPSMMQRLIRGGVGHVGKTKAHLKPVGRLDMSTEGLMVITNDGHYARELELPANHIHRTYKARVHGRLTPGKMQAIRKGLTIQLNENVGGGTPRLGRRMKYKGMRVSIEKRRGKATNTWLHVTCSEGKNRQIRRIFNHLGLDVTRLIRVGYGDYDLNTIPPGACIEVPAKRVGAMTRKGPLNKRQFSREERKEKDPRVKAVEWINY